MEENLDTRMQKCLEYIAQGLGIEKACHKAKIGVSTFYKLKNKPEWSSAYENARMKGLIASGMRIEEAQRMVGMEKEGFRIEKPHTKREVEASFLQYLIDVEGEKGISNALKQAYSALEKAFEIVENGKNNPYPIVLNPSGDFNRLYNLLWEIQHSLNSISKTIDLFKKTQQDAKETSLSDSN